MKVFEKENVTLINGDSVEVVKAIENNSIDLILTDPPYNISRDNNFHTMGRAGIDFGEWDKEFNLTSWIEGLNRVVSKNGSIIIFNDWKNMGLIVEALEKEGFIIKDMIRWVKSNPMPRNRDRRYITDYEVFVWAVKKGSKWTFNRPEEVPYVRCEYKCGLTPAGEKKLGSHTTQKPITLMEDILKVHSNEGDTILDMFMGSGSTGVACGNLNRRFIGIELEEKYFDISVKRIDNV